MYVLTGENRIIWTMNSRPVLVAGVIIAALAAVGIYGARSFLNPPALGPGISSTTSEAPELPANLPPLEQSDDLFSERALPLSEDPAFRRWLKLESLIPRVTGAMNAIAGGGVPRETLAPFAPRGKFKIVRKDGRTYADPASFARYDGFAAMVSRVDAVAAARVFEGLEPLFDAAQRGLGEKNTSARSAFFAAAKELLDVPAMDGALDLKEGKKGIGWAYVDDTLENQSLARKQLLRLGPKNQAVVQAKLRAVVLALGAPGLQP